ncbi:MAG TPA: molybdenum cofactor biosynthesis protein MoaE [Alphaproteobacteria bacterium]|nr:molybdenum cofactor biosynthesis protein MoaE [Alphaproteobacteria bacterium]
MSIRVQEEDFDVGAEIRALTQGRTEIGGVAVFIGLVRDFIEDGADREEKAVRGMTLEHYPGMTEKMLTRIEEEARSRWPLDESLIIHRVGRLEPGDNIVLVVCASAHREDALNACSFLIDWLKTKAPFWKSEATDEGEKWVKARDKDDVLASRWDDLPAARTDDG